MSNKDFEQQDKEFGNSTNNVAEEKPNIQQKEKEAKKFGENVDKQEKSTVNFGEFQSYSIPIKEEGASQSDPENLKKGDSKKKTKKSNDYV